MSKPVSTSIAGTQPIQGYTLRKRLGAGGYGEVWLADAPGGLQKAIKLIYGNVDESRASSELRSLERIRKANHPFLLSIERIEIINGRVVIVTELAESSLQDRFENYRRKGLPGIPRTELLDFLRDTADALDFLAQKHSLQHLDVKPGNLLIVAERVKVADFGLVKDLHDANQSLVSGLTPTYSAPEVFDGCPNFRSDQYSLAIVYTELLTGRLPFKGNSAGELARQHLNQAPELEPLPPADRNIVRRALSKAPQDRYATCRQFVDQLLKVRSTVVPVMENSEKPAHPANDTSTLHQQPAATQSWNNGHRQTFHRAVTVETLAGHCLRTRSMFVGIGGQGVLALRELRRDVLQNVDDRFSVDDHEWLAIDTAQEELNEVTSGSGLEKVPWESAVALPIQSPHSYRKYDPAAFTPLSRRWLYNIPRSLKTEGVRPIATLSLLAHYSALQTILEKKFARLIQSQLADRETQAPVSIYLLASLHGGTGAALLAELGMMVRSAMKRLNFTNYRVSAAVSIATTSNSQVGPNLPSANALVSLSELSHWMDASRERPQIDYRTGFATSCVSPFEWVTLVDGGLFEDSAAKAQNPKNLARVVALDCQTMSSVALADSRNESRHSSAYGWLRTAAAATIQEFPELTPEIVAQWCCLQSLKSSRLYLHGDRLSVNSPNPVRDSQESTSISQIPLTTEACEEFVRRFLRDLGFNKTTDEIFGGRESIAQWSKRISEDASLRQSQIAFDQHVLKSAIGRIVEMRVYNWPQVCRIQLKAIEAIQKFSECHLPELLRQFAKYNDLLGRPENLAARLTTYFSELEQALLKTMAVANVATRSLIRNLEHWWSLLQQNAVAVKLSMVEKASLPAQVQHVCDRVKSQLDGKLERRLLAPLEPTIGNLPGTPSPALGELKVPNDPVTDSYSQMLLWTVELVSQLCKEMSLSPQDLRGGGYHHNVVSTGEAEKFVPPLTSCGGELFRIVVASQEQFQRVSSSIEKLGFRETTTILPGTQSMGVHLLCDATQLNVAQIVTALWRPSSATLSLAERLRTRVDIDWEPVSKLLDFRQSSDTAGKVDSQVIPLEVRSAEQSAPMIVVTPNLS